MKTEKPKCLHNVIPTEHAKHSSQNNKMQWNWREMAATHGNWAFVLLKLPTSTLVKKLGLIIYAHTYTHSDTTHCKIAPKSEAGKMSYNIWNKDLKEGRNRSRFYIAHKKLPHKTLSVHSARYTKCIHVSRQSTQVIKQPQQHFPWPLKNFLSKKMATHKKKMPRRMLLSI